MALRKLKGKRPAGQFERFEGDYRAVEVREINELIDQIDTVTEPKYKVFTALVTQTGINPPVLTVLENTLGIDFQVLYNGVGTYRLIAPSAVFPQLKTACFSGQRLGSTDSVVYLYWRNSSEITLNTNSSGVPANGVLADVTPIEIRVYN